MQTAKQVAYKFIKQNADTLTPIGIYSNLRGTKKFLLESSFPHAKKGKFSFIGADPYQEFIGENNGTTILDHEKGTKEIQNSSVLSVVKEMLPKLEIDLPLPFFGGAIGYIGYDSIRSYEQIGKDLPDNLNMPDVHLMLYKSVIAFDHRNESAYLIAMNPDQQPEHVLDERLADLKKALIPTTNVDTFEDENMTFKPDTNKQAFMEKVKVAKKHIQQGDAFQIVLSQRMVAAIHRKDRKSVV